MRKTQIKTSQIPIIVYAGRPELLGLFKDCLIYFQYAQPMVISHGQSAVALPAAIWARKAGSHQCGGSAVRVVLVR